MIKKTAVQFILYVHKWGKDLQILFEIPSLFLRNEEIHKSKIQNNFPQSIFC